jgi:hypothetical protein
MSTSGEQPRTVFVSYSHVDLDRVRPIVRALEASGWTVHIDRQLPSGVDWDKETKRLIRDTYAVIVVWSHTSVRSRPVETEVLEALAKQSEPRLFPIMIDRTAKVPQKFGVLHGVDLSEWNGDKDDDMFKLVVNSLINTWTIDSGVALWNDLEVGPPLQLRKKRP